jgi:hypothetical protein
VRARRPLSALRQGARGHARRCATAARPAGWRARLPGSAAFAALREHRRPAGRRCPAVVDHEQRAPLPGRFSACAWQPARTREGENQQRCQPASGAAAAKAARIFIGVCSVGLEPEEQARRRGTSRVAGAAAASARSSQYSAGKRQQKRAAYARRAEQQRVQAQHQAAVSRRRSPWRRATAAPAAALWSVRCSSAGKSKFGRRAGGCRRSTLRGEPRHRTMARTASGRGEQRLLALALQLLELQRAAGGTGGPPPPGRATMRQVARTPAPGSWRSRQASMRSSSSQPATSTTVARENAACTSGGRDDGVGAPARADPIVQRDRPPAARRRAREGSHAGASTPTRSLASREQARERQHDQRAARSVQLVSTLRSRGVLHGSPRRRRARASRASAPAPARGPGPQATCGRSHDDGGIRLAGARRAHQIEDAPRRPCRRPAAGARALRRHQVSASSAASARLPASRRWSRAGCGARLAVGVADVDLQQEAVELRLGQRIGALLLDRVLRRQHMEGPRQVVALPATVT